MNFIEAIHLVSSESAGGHVKQAVKPDRYPRTNLRILSEQLTVGPCDVDPVRHVELRRAWNAEIGDEYLKTFGLDELRAAVAADRPVVIWATPAYQELVWFWWTLDGLERIGQRASPILVRPEPDDPLATVGGTDPEKGVEALKVARVVSDDELREGAELWRLFASPDPRGFDEARRRGSSVFPELHERAESHGTWFPRLEDGRLRLSEYDERLLRTLTDEWLMPRDLLRNAMKTPGWERALWTFGAYLVPVWRLREWTARGVVAREYRGYAHGNLLEQEAFRLTDRARGLLEDGMGAVGDAPPVHVGGCRIHDPAEPWVRVVNGSDWRIIAHM